MTLKIAMFSRFPQDVQHPRGGVESATVNLAVALAKIPEIELHLITLEDGITEVQRSTMDRIEVHRLPKTFPYQALDILIGPGRRSICRYIESLKPDIAHFHESYAFGMADLKVPLVYTDHGPDTLMIPVESGKIGRLKSIRVPIWHFVESRGYSRFKNIISISPFIEEHLKDRTSAQFSPIDNAISASYFETPRHETRPILFSAGWVSSRKNTYGLIRMFAAYVKKYNDSEIELRIAGDKTRDMEYVNQVNELIASEGLDKRVTLLGNLDQREIKTELGQASLFILTSFQEVAPMVIAEAMAVGVPVVCSNRCGMPFMVEDRVSGLLVDPEDEDATAEAVNQLVSNATKRKEFGEAAKKTAYSRFHPDAVSAKTIAVYKSIIAG